MTRHLRLLMILHRRTSVLVLLGATAGNQNVFCYVLQWIELEHLQGRLAVCFTVEGLSVTMNRILFQAAAGMMRG